MTGILRSLLLLRSDLEAIRGIAGAWPEMHIERRWNGWAAYALNGTAEPVTARTPYELSRAIREAWVATGARQ